MAFRPQLLLLVLLLNALACAQNPPRDLEPEIAEAKERVAALEHQGDDFALAVALRKLAQTLAQAKRFREAADADVRVLTILEARSDSTPARLAIARGEIAIFLAQAGENERALPYARAAMADGDLGYAPTDRRNARIKYAFAGIAQELGLYEEAAIALRRALEVQRAALPASVIDTVKALYGLGYVLTRMGSFVEARASLMEAEQLLSQRRDLPSQFHAMVHSAVGALEDTLGRYKEARQSFERERDLFTANTSITDQAICLRNIAHTLLKEGRLSEAKTTLTEALARFPADDPDPRRSALLLEAAQLAASEGDVRTMEQYARRALEDERGRTHPNPVRLVFALLKLGVACHGQGRPADALGHYDEALALARTALGRNHRHTAWLLHARGRALMAMGESDAAHAALKEALTIGRRVLFETSATLSESERQSLVGEFRGLIDPLISARVSDPHAAELVAEEVMAWQGQVLRAVATERSWLRSEEDPITGALRDQMARVLSDLDPSCVALARGGRPAPEVESLLRERERVERALLGRTTKQDETALAVRDVAKALAPDTALLQYFAYRRHDVAKAMNSVREERLLVLVIRPGRLPCVHDLGPLDRLSDAVTAHLKLSQRWVKPDPAAPLLVGLAGKAARALLFDPLADDLKDVERLIIVPDGLLSSLPFETLPGTTEGRYLIEDYEVVYAQTGFDVVRRAPPANGQGALLVGAVDFGASREEKPDIAQARSLLGLPLKSLPQSGDELDRIAEDFDHAGRKKEIARLVGIAASEDAVKRACVGRRYVHLATHGVFLVDPADSLSNSGVGFRLPTAFAGQTPALRAGIALAGINVKGGTGGADDGFLTASEAAWLDLSGCELLTLSSCDSGLGTPLGGEGLIGLRRALRLAGARATVTAVWRVRDGDAAELMGPFYAALLRGASKASALRTARLAILKKQRDLTGQALVGTWGAWVLDGDGR